MSTNGFAQGEAPGCRTVFKFANWGLSRMPKHDSPPHLQGKALDCASAVSKIVTDWRLSHARRISRFHSISGCRAIARKLQSGRPHLPHRHGPAQSVGHEGSRATAALSETFCDQLLIGEQHHGPRNAELLGEVACRWKPNAGRERARKDGLTHALVNLPEEWLSVFRKWYYYFHIKWLY